MQQSPLDLVLDAAKAQGLRIQHSSGNLMVQCPSHDDEHCSLSVGVGQDGRGLLHCFAGCEWTQVLKDLGLTQRQMFTGPSTAASNGQHVSEHVYAACNVAGEVVAHHHRQDSASGKKMWWSRPGVKRGLAGLRVTDIPLYGTELLGDEARTEEAVVITEGERAADALRRFGVLALATTTGANKTPALEQLQPLRGRTVILWPDNDKPGRLHMAEMAVKLRPLAAEVRVVEWAAAPPRGDAADFAGDAAELHELLFGSGPAAELVAAHPLVAAAAGGKGAPHLHKLDPQRTLPTAEAFVADHYDHPDGRTIWSHGGSLWTWQGNRYVLTEDARIKHRLLGWLTAAAVEKTGKDGEPKLEPFPAHARTVNDALEAVRNMVMVPAGVDPPGWLANGAPDHPIPELLPCRSATIHVPTRTMLPPTPRLFNVAALEFDHDPEAPEPMEWFGFLHAIWPEDADSQGLLQEWFGYCLLPDNRQQKMLLVVGPKRAGKGTIARVLSHLVGRANVADPTVSSLAGPFGLQGLLDKSVAIISDARFTGEHAATVTERLLTISGDNDLTVDRKFKDAVTVRLPTRFVVLTNELPRLADSAGAIASRFLTVILKESFLGREDHELSDRLLGELPGILNWALDGLDRLRARGRFLEPESSREAAQELEDLSSPVGAFIRERCTVDAAATVPCDALYAAWKGWCEADGRGRVTTQQTFGKDLRAACPHVVRRKLGGDSRIGVYQGIGLS